MQDHYHEKRGRERQKEEGRNECDVSTGDSSGGVFIQQGGAWAVAGIIYSVDGPFSTNCVNTFSAPLLDERGTCYYPTNYPVAVPSGFYASSVPNDLFWINSVIQPGGIEMTPIAATGYNANGVIRGQPRLDGGRWHNQRRRSQSEAQPRQFCGHQREPGQPRQRDGHQQLHGHPRCDECFSSILSRAHGAVTWLYPWPLTIIPLKAIFMRT